MGRMKFFSKTIQGALNPERPFLFPRDLMRDHRENLSAVRRDTNLAQGGSPGYPCENGLKRRRCDTRL